MRGVRRPVFLYCLSLVAVLACASCGSDNGTPSDLSPAAAAKWNEYCVYRYTAGCLDAMQCPMSTCMARVAEEEPLIEFVDCQLAKACDANDDDCVASAGMTDAERDAFTARCVAALSVSPSTQECALGWPDPTMCTIIAYPLIRKEHMRAVDACLMLPCGDLIACVEAAVEPLDCW
jgi:hypothetical protein